MKIKKLWAYFLVVYFVFVCGLGKKNSLHVYDEPLNIVITSLILAIFLIQFGDSTLLSRQPWLPRQRTRGLFWFLLAGSRKNHHQPNRLYMFFLKDSCIPAIFFKNCSLKCFFYKVFLF